MPKCLECGRNVKDPAKIFTCTGCGKRLCSSCYSRHRC